MRKPLIVALCALIAMTAPALAQQNMPWPMDGPIDRIDLLGTGAVQGRQTEKHRYVTLPQSSGDAMPHALRISFKS